MESIIQKEKECFLCKSPYVHKHHIFFGTANRKLSEQDGLTVWLCPMHHNASRFGVHFNIDLDDDLKQLAQSKWEEKYGTREEFIKRYGKNHL